jgi:hypothetical protein
LRRSLAIFATTLQLATPSEQGEAGRAADGRLHGLGHGARPAEVRRHLTHVQVALVEPCALDLRHHLAHCTPHRLRVLLVEPVARAQEHGLRAAAKGLGARHRGVDPVPARDVVRRRDDAAPVRVAADHERPGAQLRVLKLLHGREERVQVEVRDDHPFPR